MTLEEKTGKSVKEAQEDDSESLTSYYGKLLCIMFIGLMVFSLCKKWTWFVPLGRLTVMFFLSWLSPKRWISIVLFILTLIFVRLHLELVAWFGSIPIVYLFMWCCIFWYILWGSIWVFVRKLHKLLVKKEKLSKKEKVEVRLSGILSVLFIATWLIILGVYGIGSLFYNLLLSA